MSSRDEAGFKFLGLDSLDQEESLDPLVYTFEEVL